MEPSANTPSTPSSPPPQPSTSPQAVSPQQATVPGASMLASLKEEIEKDAATTVSPSGAPKEDWSDALSAVKELSGDASDKLLSQIQKEAAVPSKPMQVFAPKKGLMLAGVRNMPAPVLGSAPLAIPPKTEEPVQKDSIPAPSAPAPTQPSGSVSLEKSKVAAIPLVSITVPKREGLTPADIQVTKMPIVQNGVPQTPAAQNSGGGSMLSPAQEALLAKLKGSKPAQGVPQTKPSLKSTLPASMEEGVSESASITALSTPKVAEEPTEPIVSNIRTFKSDLQHTLVKQQTSIVSAISAEETRRAKRPKASVASKAISIEKTLLIVASVLLIIGGIGTVGYVFIGTRGVAPEATLSAQAPIFTEATRTIDITGFNRISILNGLTVERDSIPITLGAVGELFLYQKGLLGSSRVTTQEFFKKINAHLSDTGQRALEKEMFLGVHAFDGNQAFILVGTDYYESAYAEMLKWEEYMQSDLAPLFGPQLTKEGKVPGKIYAGEIPIETPTTTASTTDTGGGKATTTPPIKPPGGSTTGGTTGGTTGNTTGGTTGGSTTGGATAGGSTGGGSTTGGTTGGATTGGGSTGGTTGGGTTGGGTTGGTTGGSTTGGSTGGTTAMPPPPPPPPPGAWWWPSVAHAQFTPPPSDVNTSTPQTIEDTSYLRRFIPVFVDAVVKNYDVRELKDAAGDVVLLYGFPFKDTLIITTNEYTFVEAVSRLVNERQ